MGSNRCPKPNSSLFTHPERPKNFPQSVELIGLRDVRDYKVASGGSVREASPTENRLNTASPFNIKVRSLTLRDFNAIEVAQLYHQYTDDTGQVFTQRRSVIIVHA